MQDLSSKISEKSTIFILARSNNIIISCEKPEGDGR